MAHVTRGLVSGLHDLWDLEFATTSPRGLTDGLTCGQEKKERASEVGWRRGFRPRAPWFPALVDSPPETPCTWDASANPNCERPATLKRADVYDLGLLDDPTQAWMLKLRPALTAGFVSAALLISSGNMLGVMLAAAQFYCMPWVTPRGKAGRVRLNSSAYVDTCWGVGSGQSHTSSFPVTRLQYSALEHSPRSTRAIIRLIIA